MLREKESQEICMDGKWIADLEQVVIESVLEFVTIKDYKEEVTVRASEGRRSQMWGDHSLIHHLFIPYGAPLMYQEVSPGRIR